MEAKGVERVGKAVVRGGWSGEAVNLNAHEGKGCPASEGPGTGINGFSHGLEGCYGEKIYIPQIETRTIAMWRDLTNGARDIAPAKIRWLTIHAVSNSGLYLFRVVTMDAIRGGGRGVKLPRSYSGEWTMNGRTIDPVKWMRENMTKEKEPIRPISPRVSPDFWAEAGAE